jgi:hypothetical protein
MHSFIYSEMNNIHDAGYFGVNNRNKLAEGCKDFFTVVHEKQNRSMMSNIDRDSIVAYYPGSFGTFHKGHYSVVSNAVMRLLAEHPRKKIFVVIAPSNSSYAIAKYGKDNVMSTNKYRYDKIMERDFYPITRCAEEVSILVDTEPMLNYVEDQNVTDLVLNFVKRHGIVWDEFEVKPYLICGKDCASFTNLPKDRINVMHIDDSTGESTSNNSWKSQFVKKKKSVLVRYNHERDFALFMKYFANKDSGFGDIVGQHIATEKRKLMNRKLLAHNDRILSITICKDYADIFPYVKVSRRFENPLAGAELNYNQPGLIAIRNLVAQCASNGMSLEVIDSDVYSGATKKAILQTGAEFYAVHDYSEKTGDFDIIDIDDFKKQEYRYPYVDVAERCSMYAFDAEMHERFQSFVNELRGIQ